jgi:hypothetical protein
MNKIFQNIIIITFVLSTYATLSAQSSSYWNDIPLSEVQTTGERAIIPEIYRVITLNVNEIRNVLLTAPEEKNVRARNSSTILSLPLPNGGFGRFRIVDSPVMEKELSDKYTGIQTYAGQ